MPPKEPKSQNSFFDTKLTWAIVFTIIGFLGSYYLVYSKVEVLIETVREIKTDVRDMKKKQEEQNVRLSTMEVVQKSIQVALERITRRRDVTSNDSQ